MLHTVATYYLTRPSSETAERRSILLNNSIFRHLDNDLADVLLAELVLVCLAEVLEVEHLVDDRLEFHSRDETVHILESADVDASALANQTETGGEVLTVHASQ